MKKKLAFVPNPLDSSFRSSIGITSLELAKRLKDRYEVTIYTSRGGESKKQDGISTTRLSATPDRQLRRVLEKIKTAYTLRKPFFSSALYYPAYMLQLALKLRRSGQEIVHLHNFSQFIPVIRRLNPDIKIVLHMHSEWLTQLDRGMIENRLRHADLILSCSDFLTSKIQAAFPRYSDRCRTLHNGVDLDRFSGVRNGNEKNTVLMCVGRITPEKGLHTVIEAFNSVASKYPELGLWLVGQERITPSEFLVDLSQDDTVRSLKAFYPGSYQQKIMKLLKPELASRVTFTGHIDHAGMRSRYQEAGIFINASYYESFGMPVAEAMACGLPVIASNVGGVPEIIEDGRSGLLVPPGEPEKLAQAIELLLNNNDVREDMARRGRERVKALFNWDTIAERLSGYYREIEAF